MKISRQIRIVSLTWLLAGLALLLWSVIELWRIAHNTYLGINSGAFKATLESLTFSAICILGSAGLMNNKKWGRILIILTSTVTLLYAAAYLVLGGIEDTGLIYAVTVAGLFLLSVVSLFILARRKKENEGAT